MKRNIFFILLLLFTFAFSSDLIKIGDSLLIYAYDRDQNDLIANTEVPKIVDSAYNPNQFMVSNSGEIFLLNVGRVMVLNKTIEEVEQYILAKLSKSFKGVSVTVLLKTLKTNAVYVMGEVLRPGLYEVPRNDDIKNRLLNVINMSGGFTQYANKNNITIVREGQKPFECNLNKAVMEDDVAQNVLLQDGDTVIIKQAFIRVYVLGEVKRPGGVMYLPSAGIIDYVSEAGGFTTHADVNNLGIVRREDGVAKVTRVALNMDASRINSERVPVKEGDVIYVPKFFFSDWSQISNIMGSAYDAVQIYDTVRGW